MNTAPLAIRVTPVADLFEVETYNPLTGKKGRTLKAFSTEAQATSAAEYLAGVLIPAPTCHDCTTVQTQFGPAAQCIVCWEEQESEKETPDTLFAFRSIEDGPVAVIGVKTA